VRQTLGDLVDVIVDGGKCDIGLESTIVDLTSETVKVLRPGAITAQEISDAIDEPVVDYNHGVVSENPKCPGQLKQHYCTNTKLVLFEHGGQPDILTEFNGKVAVIFNKRPLNCADGVLGESVQSRDVFWFSETGDQSDIARNMFSLLQNLDNSDYDIIFCEKPEIHGLGVAINDRLLRAAAKFSGQQNEQASI
jgi:L-threonylcarbamoyladenylate synthase